MFKNACTKCGTFYDCEIWTVSTTEKKKLGSIRNVVLPFGNISMLQISWYDRVRQNERQLKIIKKKK